MNVECPRCSAARQRNSDCAEGYLHPSRDHPGLEHCNCCGQYFERRRDGRVPVSVDPDGTVRPSGSRAAPGS
jgi:MoaA/NifB/PqqE/SkfB family radical SAM enzyme